MAGHFDATTDLLTLLGHNGIGDEIKDAIRRPDGANFYRCAFQVNPFEYGARHSAVANAYATEAEYNEAMVRACVAAGVKVVGLTDHFRVSSSASLLAALKAAGVTVFPGFEANSSEGIHLLCLFEPETPLGTIERHIGACEIVDHSATSPLARKTCEQILQMVAEAGGVCIAAHVCSASGLLTTLKGHARAQAWKAEHLLAAAIAGPRDDAPQNCLDILRNTDTTAKRERMICIVNANDVTSPEGFSDKSCTTLVKMSSVSIEGLRQGFLDWESRVRLNNEPDDDDHREIVAIGWAGGLLDGQSLRLNSGLNVLVGGRGAGKSTLIESIRYVLGVDPKGEEAKRSHMAILKQVLKPSSVISVIIRLPKPSAQYYLITRIMGQSPVVFDQSGNRLPDVSPADLIGDVEVFGQHEISELTRHPDKLAEILRRFTSAETDVGEERRTLRDRLQKSRSAIGSSKSDLSQIEEQLAALPGLRTNLARFATAGLEDRLSEKTSFDAEARIFEAASDVVDGVSTMVGELAPPEEVTKLTSGEDVELPNRELLERLDKVAAQLDEARSNAAALLVAAAEAAKTEIETVKAEWEPLNTEAEKRFATLVRELEAEGHEPRKFVSIKNQVETLRPKETEKQILAEGLRTLRTTRESLLVEWEAFKAKDYRALEKAARKVSQRLVDRVRVRVRQNSDLSPLEAILKQRVGGNLTQPLERLRLHDALGLTDLANAVRAGSQALQTNYGFSIASAERIAQQGDALALEIEECELPAEAVVELNVGPEGVQTWKQLDELSTGQKATAVLLLLLLESNAPLIVDQPEDDLDNRFIADSIVPAMRVEKRRRQFIFSSHNANIPVLGDAEQIVGLKPIIDGGVERTVIEQKLCGSIDVPEIKDLVKNLLEGGQRAFTTRRAKYGF
ncbi:TrlF family AAA-like ATPase [Rhizobium leguminosarum]|uniref:TrlF family AAA-like ATPase n=1 Tax=Rhizobium leguminosarum TaxID=384 RepID=UPI00103E7252|nr:AAA family ATPase [Rhizobium leguminosarum]TBZ99466.1 phosphoesterase [Rhizobium leguminosarum bv. viciae]